MKNLCSQTIGTELLKFVCPSLHCDVTLQLIVQIVNNLMTLKVTDFVCVLVYVRIALFSPVVLFNDGSLDNILVFKQPVWNMCH